MEKSGSPPSKKDSEYKDNEGSGDSNEWSDISSSSDEGGNEGKYLNVFVSFVLIVIAEWEEIYFAYDQKWHF